MAATAKLTAVINMIKTRRLHQNALQKNDGAHGNTDDPQPFAKLVQIMRCSAVLLLLDFLEPVGNATDDCLTASRS